MFNQISWATYLEVISALLVIYYLVVAIKFFSKELLSFLASRRDVSINNMPNEDKVNHKEDTPVELRDLDSFNTDRQNALAQDADETFQQVEELTNTLKKVIADAVSQKIIKEEFILSLRLVLKKYYFLKGSPFPVAINNLIASECEKYNFIHLSAEDRVMLWNK